MLSCFTGLLLVYNRIRLLEDRHLCPPPLYLCPREQPFRKYFLYTFRQLSTVHCDMSRSEPTNIYPPNTPFPLFIFDYRNFLASDEPEVPLHPLRPSRMFYFPSTNAFQWFLTGWSPGKSQTLVTRFHLSSSSSISGVPIEVDGSPKW